MNNPKIFITGITGFVGENLKPYLAKDFNIQGISRIGKLDNLTYKLFFEENWAYDAIIHLAGKAHDLKGAANDCDYYAVNYELTKKLYDQFLQSKAEKFIYISSVKAAADRIEGVLTETMLPNPVTAYGKSKLMAENYILANIQADKQVYILRPCMIHGPGNKGNLNLLHGIVNKGIPYPLGAFKNARSFCSIDNVCFVVQQILERKEIPSGIYNIADDGALSTNDLIQIIASASNKKARILSISKKLVSVIARLGDVIYLPMNTERLMKLTENFVVDNSKIKKALHIDNMPVTSKEGLTKTIQYFNR